MRRQVTLFALFVLGTVPVLFAAEDAAIEVQFYYSRRDKTLAQTEKVLADAEKKHPSLKISRVCIDEKDGYKHLAKIEKNLDIKEPGEMTMVSGPWYLINKGEKRDIDTYFDAMMTRFIDQMNGNNHFKARLTPDVAKYAHERFGAEAEVTVNPNAKFDSIVYYPVTVQNKLVGWVVDAYWAIGCPICSDSQFLLAADANSAIIEVRPVRDIERIGTLLPEAETAKFVGQFKGKSPASLPVKVDGISRATKTYNAYQSAINEILEELKKRAVK